MQTTWVPRKFQVQIEKNLSLKWVSLYDAVFIAQHVALGKLKKD